MLRNRELILLSIILLILGIGPVVYNVVYLGFPLASDKETQSWKIEARVRLEAKDDATTATLFLPQTEGEFAIFDERFFSGDMGLTSGVNKHGDRFVTWSARNASGRVNLYYQAEVYRFDGLNFPPDNEINPDRAMAYEDYIASWSDARKAALFALRDKYVESSSDVDTLVKLLADNLLDENLTENERLALDVKDRRARAADRAVTMTLLLRMANHPTYPVNGLDLRNQDRRAKTIHWIEVWNEEGWQRYDIDTGRAGTPDTYFAWWRGLPTPVEVRGAKLRSTSFAYARQSASGAKSAAALAQMAGDPIGRLHLYDLPIETQRVFAILLMVPIGAIVLIILRQLIGLKTFGTFMPVLIALAFRETQLVFGILLLVSIVAAGLVLRSYFERLKLLSVPRLSAVLIMTVVIMLLGASLMEEIDVGASFSISLFPIVILTMTIERMSVVWEEYGPRESIQQGLGSLLAAVIAYGAMSLQWLEFMMLTYPSLLLVMLVGAILLGRYTGYRLTELRRFRSFAERS